MTASPYKPEYYNSIFETMRRLWGEEWYNAVKPVWWNIWRRHLKQMFDDGLLIAEIKAALPEAADKRRWPGGTILMSRIRDVVLKNRREATRRTTTTIDRGPESVRSVLGRITNPASPAGALGGLASSSTNTKTE